jgi:hypothetical protein
MINILKVQNDLKNLSDEQLAQEMRMPSGAAPQYLVMTEMQRRQKMRSEFSGQQPPQTTMADEMSGAAPEQPQMGAPQGGPPQGGQEQMPPTAMMAAGGSVFAGSGPATGVSSPQFGNLFGAPAPTARPGGVDPTTGYAPITEAPYVAPPAPVATNPYQAFIDSMRGQRGTPNPRVHQNTSPPGLNLPKGMSAPAPGTQGLGMRYGNSTDKAKPQYYWQSPEARDAYIRYMTPPAPAAAPVTKAGGGPIYMAGGNVVPYDPETSGVDMYKLYPPEMDPGPKPDASDDVNPSSSPIYDLFHPHWMTPEKRARLAAWNEKMRAAQDESDRQSKRYQALGQIEQNIRGDQGAFVPKDEAARRNELATWLPGATASLRYQPKLNWFGGLAHDQTPTPPVQTPTPPVIDERGHGAAPGAWPAVIPPTTNTGTTAPKKKAPDSTGVSGAPVEDQGLAAIRRTQQTQPIVQTQPSGGSEYEKQANALLDQLRGDKESDKNRDFNNALMQFGLSMAGSKNPNLLSAIAEGGLPALQKYNETREGRRKEERGLTADQLAILGKKTEIDAAQAKALQDAEQARWEREQKFPEEQRLREAQIKASMASANRNPELEILERAQRDPEFAELLLRSKSYGTIGRGYASEIAGLRKSMADVKLTKDQRAAMQVQLDALVKKQDAYLAGAGIGGGADAVPGAIPPPPNGASIIQ